MLNLVKKLVRDEKGQGMTEYALILGVIVAIVIGVMATGLDKALAEKFGEITGNISTEFKPGTGSTGGDGN